MDLFYRSGDIMLVTNQQKQHELLTVSTKKQLAFIYFVIGAIKVNYKFTAGLTLELSLLGATGNIEYFYGNDLKVFNLIKIGHINVGDCDYIYDLDIEQSKIVFNQYFEQAKQDEFIKISHKI